MRTLEDLVNHMNKYKDTVIISGSKILNIETTFSDEEFNENYTKKKLVREPEEFWKFFSEKIYKPVIHSPVTDLLKRINTSLIINQDIYNDIPDSVNIRGSMNKFICPKCKNTFKTSDSDISNLKCSCGKRYRPSVLLSGEKINQVKYDLMRSNILNTHTLFLVGVDFTEQVYLDIITDYADKKALINSDENNDEEFFIVCLTNDNFDPNELFFCEYLVKGDIKDSLERFLTCYESSR